MVTRGTAAGCSSRFTDQVLGTSAINASSSSSSSSSGTSRQQQEQQQSMQLNQLLPNPNPVNQWQQSGCDYCYYGYCYPAAIAAAKNTAIDKGKSPADTSNHEKKYRYYSPTYPLCQCWQCVSRMHASACKAASSVPEPCASNSGHLPAATSSSTTTEAAEISSSPAAAFSSHPAYYRCNPYRYHEHVSTYMRSHASVLPDPWRQSANSVRLHPYQYYPTSSADYLRRSTSQKQDYSYGWYTGQAGCQNLDSEKQVSLPPTTSATKSPIQKFLDQFTNELLQLEQTDGETATPLQVTNPVLNIAARNETPDQSNDISSLIETNDKTDEQKTEQQEQHEDPTSCSRETSEDECEEEDSSSSNHSSSSTATASSDVENEDVDDGDDDATQDAASPVKFFTEEEKEEQVEQEEEWDSEKEAAEQEKSFLTF